MVAIEDTIRLWLARVGYGKKLGYGIRQASKAQRRGEANLTGIRAKLAEQLRIAEELIPAANLREFYVDHERHAQLALRYAAATVVKNTMARHVVDASAKIFKKEELHL